MPQTEEEGQSLGRHCSIVADLAVPYPLVSGATTDGQCDEVRPSCGRCTSFGRLCSYSTDSPTPTHDRSIPVPARTPIATGSPNHLPIATSAVRENTSRLLTPGASNAYPLQSTAFVPTQPITATTSVLPDWLLEGVHPTFDMGMGEQHAFPSGVPPVENSQPPSAGLEDIGIRYFGPMSRGTLLNGSDAFWETFLGPLTQPVIPLPEQSPTVSTAARPRPSGALLSVPLLCDSSLWSSFVDSSLWNTRSVPGDDGPLLEHFSTFASTTIVVRNDQSEHSCSLYRR
jgi:hypothetical protein